MMRGSKHWPYEKVKKLWELLIPLLQTAFTNMTVETVSDWSVLAATASVSTSASQVSSSYQSDKFMSL